MKQHRRRRRRRLNPRFLVLVAGLALLLALCAWGIASCDRQEPQPEPQQTQQNTQPPAALTGWQEENGKRYYVNPDGTRATGELTLEGRTYLLDPQGYTQTGWVGDRYCLADGSMATGQVEIQGRRHFFTSQGLPVVVVNPWNALPQDYQPDLVPLSTDISVEGSQVDRSCYEALLRMLADCNAQAPRCCVVSSYRTQQYQTDSYNRKVQSYLDKGYTREEAEKEAATIIARPGTSEHQLGLAVDIIDTRLWALEEEQADLPAQKWLMEHCWEYGFILRYPKGKMDSTGIIYEPWHYRYVGQPLAEELHNLDLTLEEYIAQLTMD